MSANRKHGDRLLKLGTAICILSAAVCIVIGVIFWMRGRALLGESPTLPDLANYGGYLQGAVASVWALAGVFLILVAFLAQTRQLRQQDAEMENQQEQFRLQQENMTRQSFENLFFQLLNLQSKVASEFQVTLETAHTGVASFKPLYGRLKENLTLAALADFDLKNKAKGINPSPETQRDFAIAQYLAFYKPFHAELGHYFRNLYHIFKFIKSSEFQHAEQRRYSSLARAQLSPYELTLLFYNCITPLGDKFKLLIEEFGLLENLEKSLLIDPEHVHFYEATAYR